MSAKITTTLLILALLLLCSALSNAARPEPIPVDATLVKTHHGGDELSQDEGLEVVDENCEGAGNEECLMRRTLAAHLDYIYTQKHNKP